MQRPNLARIDMHLDHAVKALSLATGSIGQDDQPYNLEQAREAISQAAASVSHARRQLQDDAVRMCDGT
jgi:hypothetical protein